VNQFSNLLHKAAAEVRAFSATLPEAREFGADWFLSLAEQLEAASTLESDADVERQIDALVYMITDSGPLTVQFAPSFDQVVDALQRRRKREGRK
jgi:hypothetical protein